VGSGWNIIKSVVLVTRYWIIETVGGIMAKLLLTKEQVFELKDKSLSYHIIGTIMTHHLMDDLLVLHSELTRLHTAIDGAMEEIGLKYTSCEFTASYREALGDAIDILNKHLK
jgi:hypothetical protein